MKKIKTILSVSVCILIFMSMAIASSSTKEDKKDIVTDSSQNNVVDNDSVDTNTSDADVATSSNPTISEQELLNMNDIIITATEYVSDSIFGDGIKVTIQNNTDGEVMIGCSALIVNNYMINDLFGSTIAAGMISNDTIYISSRELEAAGIDTVGQVEIYFHAFDESYNYIFNDEYVVIQTSEFNNMDTAPNDAGSELYNENGIKIIGKTVDENSFWGSAILLYMENNTDENIGITVSTMAVNGIMVDPFMSSEIYAHRMAIDDITLFSSDLEENGISEINEVSVTFRIYDSTTYQTIVETDPIVFSAS